MNAKPILFNMSAGELEQFVVGMGQARFRAKQIDEWLRRGAPDFSVMKNLPETLRRDLDAAARTMPVEIEKKLESSDGQTKKFLLKLAHVSNIPRDLCEGKSSDARKSGVGVCNTTSRFDEAAGDLTRTQRAAPCGRRKIKRLAADSRLAVTTHGLRDNPCHSSNFSAANHAGYSKHGLDDGEQIECVLMRTSYGNSVCVSSQAGCAMGCKFCASTLLGLRRNLTANEMIAQVLVAQWELRGDRGDAIKPNGDPNNNDVSHIVVMGTGEPLHNMENLKGFLEYANSQLGISWRRMTVSTCGIVPGIRELTEWGRPINLAISLHAPNDELRARLMPINNKYPIADVLGAAFEHSDKTGRQLMIEYILLDASRQEESAVCRVQSAINKDCRAKRDAITEPCTLQTALSNCNSEHALELADLLKDKNCMVNLIPWNAVAERNHFTAPSGNTVHKFQDILIKNGIHTRIRRERGADIGSACGQLRLQDTRY